MKKNKLSFIIYDDWNVVEIYPLNIIDYIITDDAIRIRTNKNITIDIERNKISKSSWLKNIKMLKNKPNKSYDV